MAETGSLNREERAWVLYDAGNSAYAVVVLTALFPLFFKNYAASSIPSHLSTSFLAYAGSGASLVVAVAAPFLGMFADRSGKRKAFFVFFTALGILSLLMLVMVGQGDCLPALFLYALSFAGFTCANVFYDAFLVDIAAGKRRDTLSAAGYAWGYLGGGAAFVISMGIIQCYDVSGLPDRISAVKAAFVITAAWWLLFSVPLMFFQQSETTEPSLSGHGGSGPGVRSHPGYLSGIRATFRVITGNRRTLFFLLAYFFYIDGVGTVIKLAAAYGADMGMEQGELLAVILMVQIAGFPFAMLYGRLARKFSARIMILVAIGVYLVVTVTGFAISLVEDNSARVCLFWLLSFMVATSQGGIQALSRSFYSRLVPAGQAAEYFGIYNISGRFAAVMGPAVLGAVTQISGNTGFGVLAIAPFFLAGGWLVWKAGPEPA